MRFAFILTFVSSIFFTTVTADLASASPDGSSVSARKGKKAKRQKAKRTSKRTKRKIKQVERVADAEEAEAEELPAPTPAPVSRVDIAPKGPRVAQTIDDEEPPSAPKKKR